nr:primosomal protein N' [Granulicatella sp. 19428wC4_WM01]
MQIAKVIVDVPSSQTNQTYDYYIPEKLSDQLTIGYRIKVPFNTRYVQGFIVDIVASSKMDMPLKEIEDILDVEPVLTPELIVLGDYLAKNLFAFTINCYKVMLPSLLKANYSKYIEWLKPTELYEVLGKRQMIAWEEIEEKQLTASMLKLKKSGHIRLRYNVDNKAKHKMKRVVTCLIEPKEMTPRANAVKLQLLKQLLMDNPVIDVHDLVQQGVTHVTLTAAEKKGWIRIVEEVDERDPYKTHQFKETTKLQLNAEQHHVYTTIRHDVLRHQHQTFLIEGVTGSGKTEIYLQLIEDVVNQGQTAILLVPEIALTPQMVQHFKGRFGKRVAVLHSGLSDGERYDEWIKIKEQRADIVVGARSSIFAPLTNLGIIIIDEEHESTYKQMDTVRYHARDVAIWRGKYHQCPVVLGSATPSLESRARASKHVYQFLQLHKRANQKPLPEVQIVDMTKESKTGNFGVFSKVLCQGIEQRLAKKEQIALLLNRRGYSSFVMCRDCGYVVECPNCDISLTLHMDTKQMKCHYCGHEEAIPNQCPKCFGKDIRYFGIGTQKVEEELNTLFPHAKVIRMDVDTTRKKGQHEKLLRAFGNQEADILLGTQMIAKGLDFPNITLVGVINADTALNLPDFRAAEKTYQLLTQVAGRAGRGQLSGEVVIQTYNPEHYVIQLAKSQNYEQFYLKEMSMRHLGKYSPYFYTTAITITHTKEVDALKAAYTLKNMLTKHLDHSVYVLGPSVKSIARMNNKYYFQIILKYKNQSHIHSALQEIAQYAQDVAKQQIYISIDVEPLNFV